VIAIGVRIVAVAVAVAPTWANVTAENAVSITANEISFFKCFIS
jgi:hypothetical protein